MSVHYKFKSALTFGTIIFDGLHISVKDLKKEILQQKQIGKAADFDLQITNAQTNEVYVDENTLIPKNSSLNVVRIPLTAQQKRAWEKEANQQLVGGKPIGGVFESQDQGVQRLAKTVDLSSVDASEDDKILAMMTQSTFDYDPSNYLRIRGSCQVGEVPPSYRCFKCHQPGHWIKDCKLSNSAENIEIRKSTGIPRSFMVPVEGPAVPGAMMTPSGQFAVPSIDHQAYQEGKKPSVPDSMQPDKSSIPEHLVCSICQDLLTDTVMIPCCGTSFCDECIRNVLLESENHQCPDCKEQGISPDTLIPNRYLRTSVNSFRNHTGYRKANANPPPEVNYKQPPPAKPSSLVVCQTEPLHPPGNTITTVHPIHPISTVHGRPTPQVRPVSEIVNLVETSDNSASPIQLIDTVEHKPRVKNNLVLVNNYKPSEPIPIVPSKGVDVEPLPKLTQMNNDSRSGYVPKREDRAATPTVDERTTLPVTAFPDTSVPPPVQTFPIQPIGSIMPFSTGGFASGPYPRGPVIPMYPTMGPGPGTNYALDPARGMRSGSGYNRNYSRGRGRGGYRGSGSSLQPGTIIEDPLAAFEKMLRDKDSRYRQMRRRRSYSRSRSRSRSRTRSRTPPRKRSRTRSITPRLSRSRSRSLTPQRPPRHLSRSHSISPRPARTPPKTKVARSPVRSRTRTRSRSVTRSRSRSRLSSKRKARSFTISRSRSRSLSRTPSPMRRDRHYSPHRHDVRYASPNRTSPQRYGSRSKDYDAYYEADVRRGRGRGRYNRGRGNFDYKDPYYSPNNSRYDRYEPNQNSRAYSQTSNVEPLSQQRYNSRRFEPFDIVPPGTGPDLPSVPSGYHRGYQDEYLVPPGVADHRIVTRDRDVGRDNVRDLAARDWERTRDREIEQRERERQREYDDRYSYQKKQSQSPVRDRRRKRSHESKENRHHPVQTIELTREHYSSDHKEESRLRVPVLIDLKKEPSVEKEKKKESSSLPVKEKKKDKEKRKKKKEVEGEKKKKKKREKKEMITKTKIEEKENITLDNKTNGNEPAVEIKAVTPVPKPDPLYGDIEGTSVDQAVVENYGKVDNTTAAVVEKAVPVTEPKEPVMLAPLPELSKWELEDDMPSQEDKHGGDDGSGKDKKVVTSEVLKRAENAIFQKAINAIRPFETNKKPTPPTEKPKEKKEPDAPVEPVADTREARKIANTIQITIPTLPAKTSERSVEVATVEVNQDEKKVKSRLDRSKFVPTSIPPVSPIRLSAKERLGAKVDLEEKHKDDSKKVRSAVERKSRSKSPRKYVDRKINDRDRRREVSPNRESVRRVVVSSRVVGRVDRDKKDRDRGDREKSRSRETRKERRRERSSSRERKYKKERKHEKEAVKKKDDKPEERHVSMKVESKTEPTNEKKGRKNPRLAIDRKKNTLDEASFEPDYDESTSPESEPEVPGEEKTLLISVNDTKTTAPVKKRSRSVSVDNDNLKKKQKSEAEEEVVEKVKESEKKKAEVVSESSESDSSSDSSSESSVEEKKKRKKKKTKKRKKKKSKKRKNSSSESESSDTSSSDSDSGKGKKKKHKHRSKKRKSKKSKKSKHK